ncbi:hypothetical protein [Pseudomonas sp. LB3P14]
MKKASFVLLLIISLYSLKPLAQGCPTRITDFDNHYINITPLIEKKYTIEQLEKVLSTLKNGMNNGQEYFNIQEVKNMGETSGTGFQHSSFTDMSVVYSTQRPFNYPYVDKHRDEAQKVAEQRIAAYECSKRFGWPSATNSRSQPSPSISNQPPKKITRPTSEITNVATPTTTLKQPAKSNELAKLSNETDKDFIARSSFSKSANALGDNNWEERAANNKEKFEYAKQAKNCVSEQQEQDGIVYFYNHCNTPIYAIFCYAGGEFHQCGKGEGAVEPPPGGREGAHGPGTHGAPFATYIFACPGDFRPWVKWTGNTLEGDCRRFIQ